MCEYACGIMYVFIYIHIYIYIHTGVCIYIYVCIHMCIFSAKDDTTLYKSCIHIFERDRLYISCESRIKREHLHHMTLTAWQYLRICMRAYIHAQFFLKYTFVRSRHRCIRMCFFTQCVCMYRGEHNIAQQFFTEDKVAEQICKCNVAEQICKCRCRCMSSASQIHIVYV